jgi:hypothetical protein
MLNKDLHKDKLPDNYFDTFKSALYQKIEDTDLFDVIQDAPRLSALERKNGFLIPEDYFNTLDITNHIQLNKAKNQAIYKLIGLAASVLLLIGIGFSIYPDSSEARYEEIDMAYLAEEISNNELIIEELIKDDFNYFEETLDQTDIEILIESNLEDFSVSDLEELL